MMKFYFLSQTIDISKLKFLHFKKATRFCDTIDLTGTTKDKHKLVKNFVTFSQNLNFDK